jgi:hypothetical protein
VGRADVPPKIMLAGNVTMTPRLANCDMAPGALAEMGVTMPVNVRTVCGMIGVKFELP